MSVQVSALIIGTIALTICICSAGPVEYISDFDLICRQGHLVLTFQLQSNILSLQC